MNKDLKAILDALAYIVDENGNIEATDAQDIDKARDLSTKYVKAHPEEFREFETFGYDKDGIRKTVQAVEAFRAAGMLEMWARAEAWHFHSFGPQQIGGEIQPTVRNMLIGGSS